MIQWRNRRGAGGRALYRAGQAIVPGWRGYRRRGRKKGRRQKKEVKTGKKKEKREKKGKLKEGNHRACNSYYGALGSPLQ